MKEEVEDEGGIMIPELGANRSEQVTALRTTLIEEASRPFQIMHGPLLRVKLVRVSCIALQTRRMTRLRLQR